MMDTIRTGTILDKIVERKKERLKEAKEQRPLENLKRRAKETSPLRSFLSAIKRKERMSLIAELKRASPVKGVLRREFDVVELALLYERAGAAAISVITEEDFFCGSPEYVKVVRDAVSLPLLRKDFLFDEYQIYESRILGADAVLLIVAILDDIRISQLTRLAKELGMTALVEVHNEKELERALNCGCSLIGINNRNLKTMEVDVGIAKRMLERFHRVLP